jgi:hypothetical protein
LPSGLKATRDRVIVTFERSLKFGFLGQTPESEEDEHSGACQHDESQSGSSPTISHGEMEDSLNNPRLCGSLGRAMLWGSLGLAASSALLPALLRGRATPEQQSPRTEG